MLKIRKGQHTLKHTSFVFPGGEVGVKIEVDNGRWASLPGANTIVARLQNSRDVMELVMLVDALRRFDEAPIELFCPYVPYSRQDRMCVKGESFSLKAFAALINALNFTRVTVVDPHSDVCGAVFDRLHIITQTQVIQQFDAFAQRVQKGVTFVSPDAGSNKKTSEVAAYFGHQSFIRADKLRDLATGRIKETIVYGDDLGGRDVAILDDLCDGGATFVGLAQALKRKGAGKVILYTTHGIYSKGTQVLIDGGIDELFSTDSFYDTWPGGVGAVTTLNLESLFL